MSAREGIALPLPIVTNDTDTKMFLVDAKDLKGGWTYVPTYADLVADTFDGVFIKKRQQGMIAVVLNDETDGGAMNIYMLTTSDPLTPNWEKKEFGAQTINLNNPQTVDTITARDALSPSANDYVNVTDARTSSEVSGITQADPGVVTVGALNDIQEDSLITFSGVGGMTELNGNNYMAKNVSGVTFEIFETDGTTPVDTSGFGAFTSGGSVQLTSAFSQSYVYSGSSWLTVFGLGGVSQTELEDAISKRHAQNQDTQLVTTLAAVITADVINTHINSSPTIHRPVDNTGDWDGGTANSNTLWDAEKVREEIISANADARQYTDDSIPSVASLSWTDISTAAASINPTKNASNQYRWDLPASGPYSITWDFTGIPNATYGIILITKDASATVRQIPLPSNSLINIEDRIELDDVDESDNAVSGAVDNGGGLVRLTVTGHGLNTGDRAQIESITGTTEANGKWTVTVIDPNTIDLDDSEFINAYVSGGTSRKQAFYLNIDQSTSGVTMLSFVNDNGTMVVNVRKGYEVV